VIFCARTYNRRNLIRSAIMFILTSAVVCYPDQNPRCDRQTIIFEDASPTNWPAIPLCALCPTAHGWVMVRVGGGHTEPLPQNRIFLTRSSDEGRAWTAMQPVDLGLKANPNTALVPSELMGYRSLCTMFVATHDGTFAQWKEWMTHSRDSGRTWSH